VTSNSLFVFVRRLELRAGKRAGADALAPDRLLLGRIPRADGLVARANHAEELRVQIPVGRRHQRGAPRVHRKRPHRQAGAQDRGHLLQEKWSVDTNMFVTGFEFHQKIN